jgi:hypothetical protein
MPFPMVKSHEPGTLLQLRGLETRELPAIGASEQIFGAKQQVRNGGQSD